MRRKTMDGTFSGFLFIVYILTKVAGTSWIVVRTPNDWKERIYDVDHAWWTTGERTVFKFQVKTCSVASLQLEARAGDKTSSIYNIAIGDVRVYGYARRKRKGLAIFKYPKNINKPWIRKYNRRGRLDLLRCNQFRSFWISWADNYIKIGSGHTERKGTILLQKKDFEPIGKTVNAISFRTSFGTGEWRVERSETMETCPDNWKTGPDGDQCYMFEKSKQKWSRAMENCILKGGNLASMAKEKQINFIMNQAINKSRSEEWWTGLQRNKNGTWTWSNGKVFNNETIPWGADEPTEAKKGTLCVGLNQTGMSGLPCKTPLNHICQKPRGVVVEIATPADVTYDSGYISTEDTNHLLFELKTCKNAHINLHATPDDTEKNVIEIVLGSFGEDYMNYMQRKGITGSITKTERKLLSCHEYVPFWVSWTKKMVKIGTGDLVGVDIILEGDFKVNKNPRMPIEAISFQTEEGSPGNWRLPALKCPTGFMYHPKLKSCYNFVGDTRLFFKQASNYCKKLGGYLLIVETNEENEFIISTLKADKMRADILTGGRRFKPNSTWVWSTHPNEQKKPFKDGITWMEGEPSNEENEECLAVNINGWNDVDCFYGYQFICEAIPITQVKN
ncbi:unnamed protein product [Owenia fusiformis]|uniref:Uncharacterized protein n=1 Tax=Owenia fusiformis TaxID=6347 RepID=A0A8J1XHI5_OWEFU|nr:unnamed protein product [Owenia fusiformis]